MAVNPSLRLDLGGGVSLDLALVRPGAFTQGSPPDEAGRADDESQRTVRITGNYYMCRTSVTRGQWERFVGETGYRSEAESGTSGGYGWDGSALTQRKQFNWRNPGFPQTADHPVCLVTFADAQAFCAWLERKSQRKITLPSEAQWEYACRSGTTTAWHAGATDADCDRCAWHKGNAGNGTRPADAKQPNSRNVVIGGNVAEWCLDWYAPYQAGDATDPRQDNANLSDKPRRVLRGGSWSRDAKNTRSAARYRADPHSRNADIGFRIVGATESTAAAAPPSAKVPQPPVEAGPGGTAPSSAPATASRTPAPIHVTAHSNGSAGFGLLGGLFCLVVPVGLIFLVVRLISRSQAPPDNPFVAPPQPSDRRSIPPSFVRTMDDGFWINGDWPVGTALRLAYLADGAAMTHDLIYRPGPDGHFFYTGTRPDSVTVMPDDASARMQQPPPLASAAVVSPAFRQSGSSVPPIYPSAY